MKYENLFKAVFSSTSPFLLSLNLGVIRLTNLFCSFLFLELETFHIGCCAFYPKLLSTSGSLIYLDLFLSMCENGIPSSFPQESSVALALFARLARLSFPLALQGHPGHNSGSSVSGFSATLLELIRLSLSQDHTSHSLELHTFSIHLARQPSPIPQHTHLPPCSS